MSGLARHNLQVERCRHYMTACLLGTYSGRAPNPAILRRAHRSDGWWRDIATPGNKAKQLRRERVRKVTNRRSAWWRYWTAKGWPRPSPRLARSALALLTEQRDLATDRSLQ